MFFFCFLLGLKLKSKNRKMFFKVLQELSSVWLLVLSHVSAHFTLTWGLLFLQFELVCFGYIWFDWVGFGWVWLGLLCSNLTWYGLIWTWVHLIDWLIDRIFIDWLIVFLLFDWLITWFGLEWGKEGPGTKRYACFLGAQLPDQ